MSAPRNDEGSRSSRLRGSLGLRLAIGFGSVTIVCAVMCLMLVIQLDRADATIAEMRAQEAAIAESKLLATLVREQYVHLAHVIIDGPESHLEHYRQTTDDLSASIASMRSLVSRKDQWHLDEILRQSQRIDFLLEQEILVARREGDRSRLERAHLEVDRLVGQASSHADSLAESTELAMKHSHVDATAITTHGIIAGVLCIVLVVSLAIFFTFYLRSTVIRPLRFVADVARRFGAGDRSSRLGQIGGWELQIVAAAFDKMADEISQREAQLIEAERMAVIGQLAAGVAHEINNPIGIARGYLKTLDVNGDSEILREELHIVDQEVAACARIAEDLLTYSRETRLQWTELALDELVLDVVTRLEETGRIPAKSIALACQPTIIQADDTRLRQVVTNLVVNAVQASPLGVQVEVSCHRDNGTVFVEVADHGPGIPPGDRRRVFEPFFSTRGGGSGLGLAVCRRLVEAHGGTIRIRDGETNGSVFEVALPQEPMSKT